MTETLAHQAIEPSVLYFGTPVSLISTVDASRTTNLAPISSSWYLGRTVVLGLGRNGQTIRNLEATGECVVNLPDVRLQPAVEALAPLTGVAPVPPEKADRFRHETDKFAAAGLTPLAADLVAPPRVAECPVHLEAHVVQVHGPKSAEFAIVEADVVKVHARSDLVIEGTSHIDLERWAPLLYVFRHYFGVGDDVGRSFRAEY
ncbi:flavin reductase family protein [Solicola gregarius]|uniref:Flavin reductase family protein n=1 Tax=Solicola gregarius TaxID=2908642 RepID=A0AA46YL67_9ACTN|nr:flavin reductase family protein [Solicola gregarius]UYM06267.1 flavin reductase family protein [Solicola gregarius]